jgi:predicted DNA-binding protein YlxM (UPF0122 family)
MCKENYFTGGVSMKKTTVEKVSNNSQSNQSADRSGLEEIDKIVELSMLYDFYGELLKEHQKQIFEDYVLNDLTLSEIADEQGISRQGVHDIVKRCSKQLVSYEEKLCLIEKFVQTKNKVNQINEIAYEVKTSGDLSRVEEIIYLTNTILEDL